MRARVALLVAAMVWATVLGGCAAPASGPLGEGDPALAGFYDQAIVWEACAEVPDLECGTLSVPLDYAEPDGQSVAMALYRAPSRAEGAGSIVLLPGGPGGLGAYELGTFAYRELGATSHLVSYDARGIGATSSIDCESEEEFAARVALDPTPDTPEEEAALVSAGQTFAAGCAKAAGGALEFVGTRELVRDLDVLRAALGEDAVTYYGASYGTLVGAEYARAFPDRVARAVLDAPRTAQDWAESHPTEAFAARREAMLDEALKECFANPFLPCPLGQTPAQAREGVEALLADVEEHPVDLGGSPFTRERAVEAIEQGLGGGRDGFARLVGALGRAADGQWADLAAFGTPFRESEYWPSYLTIRCTDVGAPDVSVEEVRSTAQAWAQRYPVFGENVAWRAFECAGWPVGPTLEVRTDPVDPAGDVLVVATEGDPVTPPEFVDHAAEQLGGAPAVVFGGFEHVAYFASDCIRFAVNDFLVDGTVPEPGACA